MPAKRKDKDKTKYHPINVTKAVRDKLGQLGTYNDSMDSILRRLLKMPERKDGRRRST